MMGLIQFVITNFIQFGLVCLETVKLNQAKSRRTGQKKIESCLTFIWAAWVFVLLCDLIKIFQSRLDYGLDRSIQKRELPQDRSLNGFGVCDQTVGL